MYKDDIWKVTRKAGWVMGQKGPCETHLLGGRKGEVIKDGSRDKG